MKAVNRHTLWHSSKRMPRQRLFGCAFSVANRNVPDIIRIFKDLRGLVAIHFVLLALTMIFAAGDTSDVRFQAVYFVFVLPGWLLSPRWTGRRSPLVKQYCHALITSFLIHSWLVAFAVSLGLEFREYFIGFALVLIAAIIDRTAKLRNQGNTRSNRISANDWILWLAVMVFIVVVYRMPRSNDITQFILQQQDAVLTGLLTPSDIGMSGMGIDAAMPRWNANHWHLWPALMAVASNLSVRDVLFRFAPIPLALAAIVCLFHSLRSLCGRRMALWAVVLAVFGPVVLWYRAYNAFTYSFRITNSFCLDKDLCLFFLIPAILYLVCGWLRGAKQFLPLLLLSIPAILRFHPMTAVYLVLLTPFVLVGYQLPENFHSNRPGILRSLQSLLTDRRSQIVIVSSLSLLVAVVLIGDAQSFHGQIQEVIRIDFDQSLSGRPLHYWIGHYASIRELDVQLDTSGWTGDRFHLRFAIISDSGLFLVAHLAWLIWGTALWQTRRSVDARRWIAVGVALATLWIILLVSPLVLGTYPYLLAGLERLHWFAFIPALVSVCFGFKTLADWMGGLLGQFVGGDSAETLRSNRTTLAISFLVAGILLYSAFCLARFRPTGLAAIRGLNSRLDFELPSYEQRLNEYAAQWHESDLHAHQPEFLGDDDRVLYLGRTGDDKYWLTKQSVFWSEPYAEAFALHEFGDSFRRDRNYYYALVDHIVDRPSVRSWLYDKQITLIVDRSDGGDQFLDQLNRRHQLGMRRVESGVWRIAR
jgi:hypothetical protein